MSPAARAARDFASNGLAAIDAAIASAEEMAAGLKTAIRDMHVGRASFIAELAADAAPALDERTAIVRYLLESANARPRLPDGRLDPAGVAIAQLAYAIDARAHLPSGSERTSTGENHNG